VSSAQQRDNGGRAEGASLRFRRRRSPSTASLMARNEGRGAMASALQGPDFRLLLSCKVREGEGTWPVCGAALWRPERGGRRRGAAALESEGRRRRGAGEKGALVIYYLILRQERFEEAPRLPHVVRPFKGSIGTREFFCSYVFF
jgi:hypothetical protein